MTIEIGSFNAKARLSELLREVSHGKHYTITLRGKPIADLVQHKNVASQSPQTAIQRMSSLKKIKGVSQKMINNWIVAGRQ